MHKHSSIKVKLNDVFEYDATFCGLSKWFEHVFKKIGWIILADKKGNNDRVNEYIHTLLKLN
jgi:hypothetical protein